jgi:hypothetical protein
LAKSSIISVNTILLKKLLLIVFCSVFGFVSLQRAGAQIVPAAPMVPSQGTGPATGVTAKPTVTKILKIYNGAGYFDDALAQRLRPMLAKAFPGSVPAPAKAVPVASISAPAKTDNQKKVAEAAHQ